MTKTLLTAAALASTLWWALAGLAQDPPKDEALDSLLQKLEGAKGADGSSEAKPKAGEVAPKDQALDNLLEKLGEPKEDPTTKGRPAAKPERPDDPTSPPAPPKPDQVTTGGVKEEDKNLDDELEKRTGRIRRKKDPQQDEQGGGKLSEVIKEMREVEERLGKPDTGEETRKKQEQIVKNLDTLIEQLRSTQGQPSSRMRTQSQAMTKGGQQPGQQPGGPGAQGNSAQGVGPMGAAKPDKGSLANNKDEWGHLPPELRAVMENVFQEKELPNKEDLVRRYFLSISKKSMTPEK